MQALVRANGRRQAAVSRLLGARHAFASEAAPEDSPTYHVPAGHANSDLSSAACNIRLARRRDLKMRQDVRLHQEGATVTLAEALQNQRVVVLGLPRAGKRCAEEFVGPYVAGLDVLKAAGVDKVLCVSQQSTEHMAGFATLASLVPGVEAWADTNGAFTRMLGMEVATADGELISQRYACIADDGILLKTKVEDEPAGKIEQTAYASILEALQCINDK